MLSTNTFNDDGLNETIVSTCEAKHYPIYLTMYHPEMVYEPAADIFANRTPQAYKIGFFFSNFLANECAKSKHSFRETAEMQRRLVKNGARVKIEYIKDLVNAYAFNY